MTNERYAIWYEPSGDVYDELKMLIIHLAKKHNSPVFEPHITLLPGGTELDRESVTKRLGAVVNKVKSFETKLTSYDHSEEFFKCVFIKVEQTAAVMDFGSRIQQEFFGKPSRHFMPHLSVLYGQLPAEERIEIVKSLGGIFNKSFILEKVDVIEYRFGEAPETWKKVGSVKLK